MRKDRHNCLIQIARMGDIYETFDQYLSFMMDQQLSAYYSHRVFDPKEVYECETGPVSRGSLTIDYLGAQSGDKVCLESLICS